MLTLESCVDHLNDPQIATNIGGFGYTVNGADASILGAELEMWLKLPAGFAFSGNVGYADSKFLSDSPITGYLKGTAIPDTPKFTSSVTLHNVQQLTGALQLTSLLSYNYVGGGTHGPSGGAITLNNLT